MIPTLRTHFARDLQRLHTAIAAYQTERALWQIAGTAPNAAGNLCLHLVGNVNTYIGATLGQTGYVRKRDAEFARKDVSKAQLLQQVKATIGVVDRTLAALTDADLAREFPVLVFAAPTSAEFLLVHLTTHLAYHFGQINYHRCLFDATRVACVVSGGSDRRQLTPRVPRSVLPC